MNFCSYKFTAWRMASRLNLKFKYIQMTNWNKIKSKLKGWGG